MDEIVNVIPPEMFLSKARLALTKKDLRFFGLCLYPMRIDLIERMPEWIEGFVRIEKKDDKKIYEKCIYVNKLYVKKPEYKTTNMVDILLHELNHVLRKHQLRVGLRDPKLFNIACDHIIDKHLKELGLSIPFNQWNIIKEIEYDMEYNSEEKVYEWLIQNKQDEQDPTKIAKIRITNITPVAPDTSQEDGDGSGGSDGDSDSVNGDSNESEEQEEQEKEEKETPEREEKEKEEKEEIDLDLEFDDESKEQDDSDDGEDNETESPVAPTTPNTPADDADVMNTEGGSGNIPGSYQEQKEQKAQESLSPPGTTTQSIRVEELDDYGNVINSFDVSLDLPQTNQQDDPLVVQEFESYINAVRTIYGIEKGRGTLSSNIQQVFDKLLEVKIDWTKVLEKCIKQNVQLINDRSTWVRPNKFYLNAGFYLPGERKMDDAKKGNNHLIIHVDSSGSMSDTILKKACYTISKSGDYFEKIVCVIADVQIHQIKEFKKHEFLSIPTYFKNEGVKGRGGTSHKFVFEFFDKYFQENMDEISLYISITDMYSDIESEIIGKKFIKSIPLVILTDNEQYSNDKERDNIKVIYCDDFND